METDMESAVAVATKRFVDTHPTSLKLHQKALQSLPGGNTRTVLYTTPFPVYMRKGVGSRLYDEDGREYVDFVGELTAGLYGHSHPRLQAALTTAIHDIGLSLGATSRYEQRYAELICRRFSVEQLRFTNSGTEANLHAIAAARRFTGRRKVVAFRGGYHGGVLSFSAGVAKNNVDLDDWVLVQYNDPKAVKDAFEKIPEIAAVIVEGMQGAGGAISASDDFLRTIREECTKAGSVFILDEVMTSRLAPGGLQSLLQVRPDMTTFGKYLGGGMPFGAFGGPASIMQVYDPRQPASFSHSGTFQNNSLMLNAGFIGLSEVYTPEVATTFNARGERLRERLQQVFKGSRFCVKGRGSLMCVHATRCGLQPEQIECKDDVAAVEDNELKKLFWLEMLNAGFWVQLRGSIALNLALSEEDIELFISAVSAFCEKYRAQIALPN